MENPEQKWNRLINKMSNIPENRKSFTEANAKWFMRSGWVFNRDNPALNQLQDLIKKAFD